LFPIATGDRARAIHIADETKTSMLQPALAIAAPPLLTTQPKRAIRGVFEAEKATDAVQNTGKKRVPPDG